MTKQNIPPHPVECDAPINPTTMPPEGYYFTSSNPVDIAPQMIVDAEHYIAEQLQAMAKSYMPMLEQTIMTNPTQTAPERIELPNGWYMKLSYGAWDIFSPDGYQLFENQYRATLKEAQAFAAAMQPHAVNAENQKSASDYAHLVIANRDYYGKHSMANLTLLFEKAMATRAPSSNALREAVGAMSEYYKAHADEFDETDAATLPERFLKFVDELVDESCFAQSEYTIFWHNLKNQLALATPQVGGNGNA